MRKAHRMIHQLIEPFQPSFIEGLGDASDKIAMLVRLRYGMILLQLALIYPALAFDYLLPEFLGYYLATTLALFVFNLFAKSVNSLLAQLLVDLLSLCLLLICTAGCHNPFSSLMFVSAILGPMFLGRKQSTLYLVVTAAGFTTVCLYTEPVLMNAAGHEVSPVTTIAAKVLVLFILGFMTLWLKGCLERMQSRVDRLYKQKQRLNNFRALGVVAGQLSHELSTPLNTLKIMMDKMERRPELEGSAELRIAKSALKQCETTVRNLFDSNVDADSLSFKETSVSEFVRSVCEKWQMDFPRVRLALDFDASTEHLSYALPVTPFAQAVMDILDNAKDASETEDETQDNEGLDKAQGIEIKVALRAANNAWNLSITDQGRGIDQEILSRIGEPFLSTKKSGTGLGLYNAVSLLEALGGSLGLSSAAGGGTRVQMVLPL